MRFEDYLDRETQIAALADRQRLLKRYDRQKRRLVRQFTAKMALAVSVILWAVLVSVIIIVGVFNSLSLESPEAETIEPLGAPCLGYAAAAEPEPVEPTPTYYDIPFSNENQDLLRSVCEETGVPFELAVAVVWKETNFRNVKGDGGRSYGYMQVQPRWHTERMERLGVDDLMDPAGNFKVGCDFLAELLDRYPVANALAYYNSGSSRVNAYAEKVLDYMERLQWKI